MNSKIRINRSKAASRSFAAATRLNLVLVAIATLLIISLALWVLQRSESALNNNLKSKLTTILNIEIEAIKDWIQMEKRLANFLAADFDLVESVAQVFREPDNATLVHDVRSKLLEASRRFEITNCLVLSVEGQILAETEQSWITDQLPLLQNQLTATLLSNAPTVSKPFVHNLDLSSLSSINDPEPHLMFVAAPINNNTRDVIGFVGFGVRLDEALTRLVGSSRTGESGETLVINESGDMISGSRFGIRSDHNSHSPQFDARQFSGFLPDQTDSQTTTIVNLDGFLDYRGETVVGTGRWLPKAGFGVMTKMDRTEANAPLIQVRQFLRTMCGLLLLTTTAAFFYRWYLDYSRKLARNEELRRKQLGPYVLDHKVGEGGMGVVYRARHALLRRPTAVKILPPEKSSQGSIARFEREVHLTSQLKHPNTISIYDFGRTENDLFYYAMEYLDGLNLEQLLARLGQIPDGRVIHILKQVCGSLAEAHGLGLIHRDIKPANIMLCNRGGAVDMVKVLDFGMVRDFLSEQMQFDGALSGTPAYMAPEAFANPDQVDSRVDIFAIGAVGFYLLTGQPLLVANDLNGIIQLHKTDLSSSTKTRLERITSNSRCSVNDGLISLISKSVASDRNQRTKSAAEFLLELQACEPNETWTTEAAKDWWQCMPHTASADSAARPDRRAVNALVETTAFRTDSLRRARNGLRVKNRFIRSMNA